VRQRQANEPGTWDLYTINVDGSDLKKVAADGVWGTWISPDEILFVRDAKVVRAKLDGSDETELVDTAAQSALGGATVRQPQLSPDGKYLALTLADSRRQVGVWKIKKKHWTQVGPGTQATWTPDGAALVWIGTTGKGLSQISRMPIQKGVPAEDGDKSATGILDLQGRRSREAFPRVSNDGKWMVFSSSINSLENDVEDFEIYVWEVGSPADAATRLTFNTGNDSWPDIYTGPPSPKAAEPEAAEKAETSEGDDNHAKPKAAGDEEAQDAEKPATEQAAHSDAAAEEAAGGAEEDAAPSKAKGKGKKPSPKAKKKHR
jgi:Tol biopolymer transport system component